MVSTSTLPLKIPSRITGDYTPHTGHVTLVVPVTTRVMDSYDSHAWQSNNGHGTRDRRLDSESSSRLSQRAPDGMACRIHVVNTADSCVVNALASSVPYRVLVSFATLSLPPYGQPHGHGPDPRLYVNGVEHVELFSSTTPGLCRARDHDPRITPSSLTLTLRPEKLVPLGRHATLDQNSTVHGV